MNSVRMKRKTRDRQRGLEATMRQGHRSSTRRSRPVERVQVSLILPSGKRQSCDDNRNDPVSRW